MSDNLWDIKRRNSKTGGWFDVEPTKDSNIKKSKEAADMARQQEVSIHVKNADRLNQEILDRSLRKVEQIRKELPQVEKLIKQYNGVGTQFVAEPFIDKERHTSLTADGDTSPKTGEVRLNAVTRLSKDNSTEDIIKACEKSGTFGKYGRSLSSTAPEHTVVHEYGHIIHLALCCKEYGKDRARIISDYSVGGRAGELISIACHRTGVSLTQFRKELGSYSSGGHNPMSETFSEAVANAVLAGKQASKTSLELWKLIKEELG